MPEIPIRQIRGDGENKRKEFKARTWRICITGDRVGIKGTASYIKAQTSLYVRASCLLICPCQSGDVSYLYDRRGLRTGTESDCSRSKTCFLLFWLLYNIKSNSDSRNLTDQISLTGLAKYGHNPLLQLTPHTPHSDHWSLHRTAYQLTTLYGVSVWSLCMEYELWSMEYDVLD